MAKRPAPEAVRDETSSSEPQNKRRQTEGDKHGHSFTSGAANIAVLSGLLENADELIECLQQLKRSKSVIAERDSHDNDLIATQHRLCAVSKSAVPQLQVLVQPSDAVTPESDLGQVSASTGQERAEVASSPLAVEPWQASETARELPPLPPIKEPKLENAAFTHKGVSPTNHYERLEWVGDAYLELIATLFIEKTFQKLPSGRLSQMRERLIRNTQLAEYFREYRMQSRAQLPSDLADRVDLGRGSSKDKDLQKTQGDMFEAYVAAVILSDPVDGLGDVVKWLKMLWSRTLRDDIQKNEPIKSEQPGQAGPVGSESQQTAKRSPKEELGARIVVKGVAIRYETMECSKKDKHLKLPLFSVGAYLEGWGETHKLLGVGTALNVKEAGQKAATAAMQNKKLLGQFEAKKAAFLAARAAGDEKVQ